MDENLARCRAVSLDFLRSIRGRFEKIAGNDFGRCRVATLPEGCVPGTACIIIALQYWKDRPKVSFLIIAAQEFEVMARQQLRPI